MTAWVRRHSGRRRMRGSPNRQSAHTRPTSHVDRIVSMMPTNQRRQCGGIRPADGICFCRTEDDLEANASQWCTGPWVHRDRPASPPPPVGLSQNPWNSRNVGTPVSAETRLLSGPRGARTVTIRESCVGAASSTTSPTSRSRTSQMSRLPLWRGLSDQQFVCSSSMRVVKLQVPPRTPWGFKSLGTWPRHEHWPPDACLPGMVTTAAPAAVGHRWRARRRRVPVLATAGPEGGRQPGTRSEAAGLGVAGR